MKTLFRLGCVALLATALTGRALADVAGWDSSDTLIYWMVDDSSNKIKFDYAVVYAAPTANLEGKAWTAESGYGDVGAIALPVGVDGGFGYSSNPDTQMGTLDILTSLGALENYSSYSFYIELLHWDGASEIREGVSALSSYDALVENHHILRTGMAIPSNLAVWAPATTVPEPTSGLLLLFGCAALLLRRRNGRG